MMAEIGKWSRWRPFPDPTKGGFIIAPFGPGCYELRLAAQVSSFGSAGWVAYRMSSLHPKGLGTRKNTDKRVFVGKHLLQLEYRVIALVSREDPGKFEQREMRPRRRRILSNALSRRAGTLKLEQEFRKPRTVGGRWP